MADIRTGNFSDISGEVNIAAGNIIKHIQTIYERALTPGEVVEKDLEIEVNQLASGVRGYLERLQQQVVATETPAPYKRLDSYALSDAQIFSGRDQDIQALENAIKRSPLTILQAESGAGKTSLLKAGLIPRMIARGDLAIWVRAEFNNPARKIKESFIEDLELTPKLANTRLVGFLRRVSKIIGHDTTLVLILDQFEEFFSKLTSDQDRKDFIEDLATCLNDATLNVRWVISITTDSFGQLGKFEPQIQNPFSNQQSLYLFNRQQAIEVITKPAASHGLEFEAGLLDRLLDDLLHDQKDKVAPTQIQLVCDALCNDLKKNDRLITQAMYNSKGGAEGILHDYIGNVMQTHIPPEERSAAYKILEALVTSEKKRIIRSKTDLTAALEHRGVSHEVTESTLNHLLNQRLLRQFGDGGERAQYELVHDYLLGEIEINEELRKVKEADELLEQGVRRWKKTKNMLLSLDELNYIEMARDKLSYPDIHLELLIRSAAHYSRPFSYFLNKLAIDAKKNFILDLCNELEGGKTRDERIARKILIAARSMVPRDSLLKSYGWYLPRYGIVFFAFIIVFYFTYSSLKGFLQMPESSGWQSTNTFIDQTGVVSKNLILTLDLQNPDLIFAADPNGKGIYKSTDGGLNWFPIIEKFFQNESVKGIVTIGDLVYVITNNKVFKSTDSGTTWTEKTNPSGSPEETLVFVALNLYSLNEVYVGSSTGRLYLSDNRADKWADLPTNGMAGTQIRAIAVNNKLRLVATERGLWEYNWKNSTWQEVSLRECLDSGAKNTNIIAIAIPRATYGPDQSDFTVSVTGFGLCNSDTKGAYESITYLDQPSENIYSIAIKGDLNNLEAQVYVSTDSGMYCGRVWYANESEWWYKKINQLLHRNIFPLPCTNNTQP